MSSSPRSIRVVKIGGSLIELDDARQKISDWISQQPPATTMWIVGGGRLVEEIRLQNERSELDAEEIHWACIEKMNVNARRIGSWFPNWITIDSFDDVSVRDPRANLILKPLNWSRQHASHLPKTWDVTSDSIAATLAHWIGADELVLLKSANPPIGLGVQAAVDLKFVDQFFWHATIGSDKTTRLDARYRIRAVNLRDPNFRETVWKD